MHAYAPKTMTPLYVKGGQSSQMHVADYPALSQHDAGLHLMCTYAMLSLSCRPRAGCPSCAPSVALKVVDAVESAALLAEALRLPIPHQRRQLQMHLTYPTSLEILPPISQWSATALDLQESHPASDQSSARTE